MAIRLEREGGGRSDRGVVEWKTPKRRRRARASFLEALSEVLVPMEPVTRRSVEPWSKEEGLVPRRLSKNVLEHKYLEAVHLSKHTVQ